MKNITHTLIKRGLNELLAENESYFKENVIKTITFKLNESIKEVKGSIHKNLLFTPKFTKKNDDIIKFVNFVENYMAGRGKSYAETLGAYEKYLQATQNKNK